MDDEQQAELDRAYREKVDLEQLEAVRATLTKEQLADLERHAASLREQEIYAPKYETQIAKIIRVVDYAHKQGSEIKEVYGRAEREARGRDAKEQLAAKMLALKEAEQRQQQQAKQELSDSQRQHAAEVIARRQRDFEAGQFIRDAAGIDRERHQNGRYNELRKLDESPQKEGVKQKENDWQRVGREVAGNTLKPQAITRGGRKP